MNELINKLKTELNATDDYVKKIINDVVHYLESNDYIKVNKDVSDLFDITDTPLKDGSKRTLK